MLFLYGKDLLVFVHHISFLLSVLVSMTFLLEIFLRFMLMKLVGIDTKAIYFRLTEIFTLNIFIS